MEVSITELKANLSHYLSMILENDLIITKNGKKIARITREEDNQVSSIRSLFGILPPDSSLEEIKAERMKRYEGNA